MSRPLGALSGQDLALPGLADNFANRSPVKVAPSKAKYLHSVFPRGKKWVDKARSKPISIWSKKKKKKKKKLQLPRLNNAADEEEKHERRT